MIYKQIKEIVYYGLETGILNPLDYEYAINKLIDLFGLDAFVDVDFEYQAVEEPSNLLKPLLDYACEHKLIDVDTVLNRDLFEAKIMDCIIPRPSEVYAEFAELYHEDGAKSATDYYYYLSQKSNYIKTSRTNKNIIWKSETPYGVLDMTINLSKPEKDPRDIIASGKKSSTDYPKCLLCKEHVGFSGRPGRTSHRIIPLELNDEFFYLQYSPYVYYNEHCIVLMAEHEPMDVTEKTFKRLFDFVDQFPHYFLGSNAGLPIVGGSILSHEHYQGGNHHFAMEDAKVLDHHIVDGVEIERVYWPLSVLRLRSENREKVEQVALKLYDYWKEYSDESVGIFAHTDAPHNAITPIVRKKGDLYELDMTLRNNLTSEEFPLGIFHPHPKQHNIKKENIGLIEVMGLAVLPARLEEELPVIEDCLVNKKELPAELSVHKEWLQELRTLYTGEDAHQFLYDQVAKVFMRCIEDSGVFKQDKEGQDAFIKFTEGFVNVLNK